MAGNFYYGSSVPTRGREGNTRFEYSVYANKPYVYKNDHLRRGICLIINNHKFPTLEGIGDRPGSEKDVETLRETFTQLAFDVRVKQNRSCCHMIEELETAAEDPLNKQSDCFVFILMTHGMPENYYCGTDGQIKLEDLLEKFQEGQCPPSLLGKPKIFIIQGCRGGYRDMGIEVADAERIDRPYFIPEESDKLYVYASSFERNAYRHTTHGSWFVQVLCGVLREHSIDTQTNPPTAGKEFMWMMHRVCHVIAHEFDDAFDPVPKKQMPQIMSNLTKELYFTPKTHQQETSQGRSEAAFNSPYPGNYFKHS